MPGACWITRMWQSLWEFRLQVTDFANPYALSMGGAVLAVLVLGYLVALGMAALTLALSARLRTTMTVAVIPIAVVFLGVFGLFVKPLAKVCAITPMGVLGYSYVSLVSYSTGPAVTDLPTLATVLYALLLVACLPLAMRTLRRHQVA